MQIRYQVQIVAQEREDFAEASKNLRKSDLKLDLKINLNYQNNYVGNSSMMSNATKSIYILATNLNVLHKYVDSLIKLFSDLYV